MSIEEERVVIFDHDNKAPSSSLYDKIDEDHDRKDID